MMHVNRGAYPQTQHRDLPVCGRCSRCHPGLQWGHDAACRALQVGITCPCHRGEAS